jgi:S-adenosylmethionine:tRNA ribosyltransferase-isomerase
MDIALFDYPLPENLIARRPAERREESRLMVLRRREQTISHARFYEIPDFLCAGDVLVLNDSRVMPTRLIGRKLPYGGNVEILLLRQIEPLLWTALVRPGKKILKGDRIIIEKNFLEAEIIGFGDVGERFVRFTCNADWWQTLQRLGHTPLPPYILKARKKDAGATRSSVPLEEDYDRDRYQTVYAAHPGSAAAPTAGLHFSPELLEQLRARGVQFAFLTLHIGAATFRPVTEHDVEQHRMHAEAFRIDAANCELINRARREARRIIAVGTTAARVLETIADQHGIVSQQEGETMLMILPGYNFRAVDALLTNFHLPRTTLLMLVAAFAALDFVKRAYAEAVEEQYRFYSYGDAMLIL